MTMAYRVVLKSVLDNILKPNAFGRYAVKGYMPHSQGLEGLLASKRLVSCYYDMGEFKGSLTAPEHDITYLLDLMVASQSKADLKVLERDFALESDAKQAYSRALMDAVDGSQGVDNQMDELIEIVYQLLMSKENDELGVDRLTPESSVIVSSRNVIQVQKYNPEVQGSSSLIVARMKLTCTVCEEITGLPLPDPVTLPEVSLELQAEQYNEDA